MNSASLAPDVVRLVIAARIVAFEDKGEEAIKELDEASEAFADRVPWDDEPFEDAALSTPNAPVEQREAERERDRALMKLLAAVFDGNAFEARALAAETRLAEAMRVIERCEDALSRCYQVTEWPADGTTSQDEALTAARAFTNAAKDANNG